MSIIENILIINYLYVFIIYIAHLIRISEGLSGFTIKELLTLLIPFVFIFCIVKLLLIIIKENIN